MEIDPEPQETPQDPKIEPQQDPKVPEEPEEVPILNILDEDFGTVIYKLTNSSAKMKNFNDVADDFFDLTIEDAKILLKDVRKMQKDLSNDEKVLMTESMRQTQKEGQKLAILNRYKKCAIRVQLPDRHVIQAYFSPGATLNQVLDNVKKHIEIQNDLEIFITPPKTVLDLNSTLLDCDLVPAALVYLSCKNSEQNGGNLWISPENSQKLSNMAGAEQILSQSGILRSGGHERTPENEAGAQEISQNFAKKVENAESSQAATKRPPTSNLPGKSGNKVPRWFKPSK